MACPFFEPSRVASDPRHPGARLPLIDEYDGLCHAATPGMQVPRERRFECCNHGHPYERCPLFHVGEGADCFRYSVVERSESAVHLTVVEERGCSPLAWHVVQYSIPSEQLSPDVADPCTRAQVIAFCRSLLKRFPQA